MIVVPDAAATEAAGRRLTAVLQRGDLVILTGPLGAGKTTFTRGVGEGLAVRGPITSPTFVIARVHPSLVGGPELLHVDAYRLDTAEQLWDLDLETEAAVTVVEWGRGKAEQLQTDWLEVSIDRTEGGSAVTTAPPAGASAAELQSTLSRGSSDEGDQRLITWRSQGERWRGVDLAAVLAPPM